MSTANLNIRLDENVKNAAEKILSELGLNMTTAITIYLRQVARQRAIPFALSLGPAIPQETWNAMQEAKQLLRPGVGKEFHSIEELRQDWMS